MGDKSAIEWTDATWNVVTGCTKISPGCANCYIDRTPPFRMAGRQFDRAGRIPLVLHPDRLDQPLRWKRPRRIFVNSLSDLFHERVPDAFIQSVFTVMAIAKQHVFQVLTKRPQRMWDLVRSWRADDMYDFWYAYDAGPREIEGWPLPNVWLGVSVENQRMADERIPLLLQTPAAVRFISAEPLLGPIDIRQACRFQGRDYGERALDWVIVGGESGPGARPFDLAWARSLVDQCKAAGVACFVKQLGDVPVMDEAEWRTGGGRLLSAANHRRAPAGTVPLKLYGKKGGDPSEWPEELRVREYPRVGDVGGSDQAVAAGNTDCPGL